MTRIEIVIMKFWHEILPSAEDDFFTLEEMESAFYSYVGALLPRSSLAPLLHHLLGPIDYESPIRFRKRSPRRRS
jgi:hypothetical protein